MDKFDVVIQKVKRAAEEIVSLKKENRQMLSELNLLREEIDGLKQMKRSYDILKKNEDRLKNKLIKLAKKIENWTQAENPADHKKEVLL